MDSHRHREPCSPQVPGTQVQRDTDGHNVRRLPTLRPAARKDNARNRRLGSAEPHRQSTLTATTININCEIALATTFRNVCTMFAHNVCTLLNN